MEYFFQCLQIIGLYFIINLALTLIYALISSYIFKLDPLTGGKVTIKIPPSKKMLNNKEPIYKVGRHISWDSTLYVTKFIKVWVIPINFYHQSGPKYAFQFILSSFLPFFLRFKWYKYVLADNNGFECAINKEKLKELNSLKVFYEEKYKIFMDTIDEKNKETRAKLSTTQRLNQEFNENYIK